MTVQSQLDDIYDNRGNILKLMRTFDVLKNSRRFSFVWNEIPLDENDFNETVAELEIPKCVIKETKQVLNNIIGTADDGKVILINTSIYGIRSFTVKVELVNN